MTAAPTCRGAALAAVHRVPGSHLRALQRMSDLALGTLRYHLDDLVGTGVVDLERDRRFARYYPAPMPDPTRRVWDALRQAQSRRIVASLLDRQGMTQAALAQALRLPPTTVHLHCKRLQALGVVVPSPTGLRLADPVAVQGVLLAIAPTRLDSWTDAAIDLFDGL